MPLSTADIRKRFLDFFERNGHRPLGSAPLVPRGDPTLMFTNAGMVPFKDVFTGLRPRSAPRVVTVQKCIRISGKHNDLENVGRTSRHHTFFEMLGNFSFGDYFKEDACRFGFEFLTGELGLPPERLWISVFAGDEVAPADDEAAAIWRDRIGVPAERILRGSAKDNFWAMGDTGPCGPCSEIMYDRGERFGEPSLDNGERFFELWNLVFMQYQVAEPGGPMAPLPAPCIDTGAGLERIASVLQGVDSNYDTDGFRALLAAGEAVSGRRYGADPEDDVSLRVISDHARMAAHLVAEGVFPEKTGREYVLRRVMRRAIRHGHRLGIAEPFLHRVAGAVVETMGSAYPELAEHRELIERVCRQEEERFRLTLDRGLELLERNADWAAGPAGERVLPGALAFDLTATYGFPLDLIEVIGREQGFGLDGAGYRAAQERHRAASGAGKIGEQAVPQVYSELHASLGDTSFVGYERERGTSQVLAVIRDGATVIGAGEGERIEVVLAETPFYGEAGGQVGDTGEIRGPEGTLRVLDTLRPLSGLWVHRGVVAGGRLRPGDEVEAVVDGERRSAVRRHHTATHLLHEALRALLGAHATQKGSRVGPDLLRFDFAHFEPLSADQLAALERRVNAAVMADTEVRTELTSYDEARATGATALFEETYGDQVRLVRASERSAELCGGTHVTRTGQIGPFAVVTETGIAAGVRRIEAVVGAAAVEWLLSRRAVMDRAARLLRSSADEVPARIEKLFEREKELSRELEAMKRELAGGSARGEGDLLERAVEVGGIRVLGARLGVGDPATLRETADTLCQRLGSGVVCVGGEHKGKAAVVVAVTGDLTGRLDARRLIEKVAAGIGGRGGGRADFAQAGGPDPAGLDEAVGAIRGAVEQALAG
jgi:alanyl-tRNA synthetase